ncbi:hypothetical protein BDV93DRAFT_982 [Ceratobasidium sp. AG-I]|nr:hypothetical protein BDV93DRAFT_982 [Ceratobasidium sp. AG-I]
MSTPDTVATLSPGALRRRTITQGAKLVVEPLTKFAGVPGVQDFVKTARELVAALKPRVLQTPGVNDASAAGIVSQIVEIASVVGDAMEQLDAMDDAVARAYLEKLRPFTEYLKETKAEISQQQQRPYTTKLALQRDMAELLARREDELRRRTVLLCLEKILLVDQTVAQTHHTLVQIRAQLVAFQAHAASTALYSTNCHKEIRGDMAMLKAEMTTLRTQLDSRSNFIAMFEIHQSIFFSITRW